MSNDAENYIISQIQKKRATEMKAERELQLFKEMLPALRQAIRAGGSADAVLKKSETIAAYELIKATQSDKDEVRLKAATEILNRTIGRPVERSISIYGDLSRLNEKDVDQQIMLLLDQTGAKKLMKDTGMSNFKKKQKRKPRTTLDAEFTVREGTASGEAESTQPSPEAGTSPESQD